jgi:hypothetical protein
MAKTCEGGLAAAAIQINTDPLLSRIGAKSNKNDNIGSFAAGDAGGELASTFGAIGGRISSKSNEPVNCPDCGS